MRNPTLRPSTISNRSNNPKHLSWTPLRRCLSLLKVLFSGFSWRKSGSTDNGEEHECMYQVCGGDNPASKSKDVQDVQNVRRTGRQGRS